MSMQEIVQPMGQCAVTGKMVPEDELVTIQGQRVCAEGKAILLDRLKAGENAPGELTKPGVMRRFGCIFLDGLIIGVPVAIVSFLMAAGKASPMMLGAFSLVAVIIQIVYFGQLHGTRGQSVGKMAGSLRVINMNGSPITLQTGYIRAVAYVGPSVLAALATIIGVAVIVMVANAIVVIYGLINVLMALFDRKMQRALHDRIAGTRVIQLN